MPAVPKFVCLSLRYNYGSESIFGNDGETDVTEETHVIPVYDCYAKDVPQGQRGDEYCHYYVRDYANRDLKGKSGSFRDMIDPDLVICCRKDELFYSDSENRFFSRLEGAMRLRKHGGDDQTIIGTLEEMLISL